MKNIHLLLFFLLLLALPYEGFSATIHIPADYSSIQAGIDASSDGDIVLVDPGTYYEHLNPNGKNITLCSNFFTTGNSSFITSTVIDGSNTGRIITIDQGENSSCYIVGFSIQNGNTTTEAGLTYGGGIFILDSSPQILNCIIQNNFANGYGGGLAIHGLSSNAKVMHCTIQNNSANGYGGGLFIGDCGPDAEVINCIISGNTNTYNDTWNGGGGGVNLYHTGKLTNCLVINNNAPNSSAGGGGIQCDWGDYYGSQGIFVTGCTIANNTALDFGGVSHVDGLSGGEFRNCIIWGNTDINSNISNWVGNSYVNSCSDPLPAGTGNISSDPNFVNPASDFRLSAGSPCIDLGDNAYNTSATDLDGNPRIKDVIDMGAYEYGSSGGVTVQIGSGTDISDQFPIYSYYGYSYSQQIYLESEIASGGGAAGSVTKIRFYFSDGGTTFSKWNNWNVYLGNTTKSEFSNSADWVPVGSMTQVFSGIIPDPVAGTWVEITLPTPFYYSGNNIVVAVDENSDDWDFPPAQWSSFNSGSARGLLVFDDYNNPDPASPSAANNGPEFTIAQVQFDIGSGSGSLEGYVTEEPGCTNPVEGATITTGSYTTTSNASGFYQLSLPIGTYFDITAHHGDVSQTISPVFITGGNITTLDFCLPPYFAPPVSLQASISGPALNDVHLTWLEPGSVADQWIHWDDGSFIGGLGYGGPAYFSVASRWPVSDIAPYNGTYLKKIRFIITEPTASYTLKVWKGADASTLLHSQIVTNPFINTWTEVTLSTPVLIDGTDEFWFGYDCVQTTGYPAGLSSGPAVAGKGDMISAFGGAWISMKNSWNYEFNWPLQGFVSESAVLAPQQLIPMVQNTSPPVLTSPVSPSMKPQIVLKEQAASEKLPSDILMTGEHMPKPVNHSPVPSSAIMTGYNVYRDNVKIGDNITDLFYDDPALPKGGYDYEVSAQYDLGESSRIGVHVDIYTCFPPTGLTVSNATLTTTTADFSWTPSAISTNTEWDIEYAYSGFPLGTGNTAFVSGTPAYTVSNLVAGVEYDFYIRTHCSSTDRSAWVKKTFRTHYFDCPAATSELEICGNNSNNGCDLGTPAFETISCGQTVCGTSWLHRSQRDSDWYSFTLTETKDVTLYSNAEFSYIAGIKASPCPSAGFIVAAYNSPWWHPSVWAQLTAGTYYVYMAPNYNEQVSCDSLNRYWLNITCSTCLTPQELSVTNITENSADLVWTSNAGLWDIEWGIAGFSQGSGTMIFGTDQKPYALTGLTEGYSYSYYIRSDCGGGVYSYWAGPYIFFLPCPAVSLPFTEDFTSQSIGITPQCWRVKGAGSPSNWMVEDSYTAGGVSPQLLFNYYPYIYGDTSFLISPVINTSGQTEIYLSFKHYIYFNNSNPQCQVLTTSDGGITWNSVWSFSSAGSVGPENLYFTLSTVDVGSATFQFAFAFSGYSYDISSWQIDDIELTGFAGGKTLDLKVYLEGLYAGGGTMNQAYDDLGPHFGPGIADQVTVELHNEFNYATIEYSSGPVNLNTTGNILINSIPGGLSGSYYITIRHRNSIETTSALPVSFAGSTTNYDFTTSSSQVFGDNVRLMGTEYAIWGGDVNQDGIVDSGDMNPIENASISLTAGYVAEDVNGDGLVDSGDMNIVENNSIVLVSVITP